MNQYYVDVKTQVMWRIDSFSFLSFDAARDDKSLKLKYSNPPWSLLIPIANQQVQVQIRVCWQLSNCLLLTEFTCDTLAPHGNCNVVPERLHPDLLISKPLSWEKACSFS